jgi:amino acid permease
MSASSTLHETSYGTITPTRRPPSLRSPPEDDAFDETRSSSSSDRPGTLHRGLSSRQVQMIAIGGTIGTGLFLGTGRSLAQGGPASMFICYSIVGFIVYVTLLLLGEMATQYPIAGEYFSVCLAMFAEKQSHAASITFPSFSFLVSTYKCTESREKTLCCVLLHFGYMHLPLK